MRKAIPYKGVKRYEIKNGKKCIYIFNKTLQIFTSVLILGQKFSILDVILLINHWGFLQGFKVFFSLFLPRDDECSI